MPTTTDAWSLVIGDCLNVLKLIEVPPISLVYLDPPWGTGDRQQKTKDGPSYLDVPPDEQKFVPWLMERIAVCIDKLTPNGSILVHLDDRELHYVKVEMDKLMGRQNFLGSIIWAADFGGHSKKKWSQKHSTILWYTKNCNDYIFNYDAIDRVPYMAPGLAGPEKAARGKAEKSFWVKSLEGSDVLWQTIVPPGGRESVDYPSQKPLGLLNRIIRVHSNPGDWVLDPFCGSFTTGVSAVQLGRKALGIDILSEAIEIAHKRLHANGK